MKHLKKESRRDKETHVLGVDDLGRHHGLSEPLELAHPLLHDHVDGVGLPPPAERHHAGPGVVEQEAEDPEKERIKETEKKEEEKEDSKEEEDLRQREEDTHHQEHDISLKEER